MPFHKGYTSWSKGLTKETDERLALMGKKVSITLRKMAKNGEIRYWNKGLTKKTDYRIAEHANRLKDITTWNKGLTKENDFRVLKNGLGVKLACLSSTTVRNKSTGIKLFYSTLKGRKNIVNLSRNRFGQDNPNWKGGITYEIYPSEFNSQLRELIRRRDGYTCQVCGIPECEFLHKLCVHHINYNKRENHPSNLVSLCSRCNSIANARRYIWIQYFKNKNLLQIPLNLGINFNAVRS